MEEKKKSFIITIKILSYIYGEENISIGKIARAINVSEDHLKRYYLKKFEQLGLIEYKSFSRGYMINKKKIVNALECLENPECKKETIKIYYIPYKMTKRVLEYLRNKSEERVNIEELTELLNVNYSTRSLHRIVYWLKDKCVLFRSSGVIKMTEKGKKVYEEIINPILEVAENPDNVIKYREELSDKDKWELLEIYSSYKSAYRKREKNCFIGIARS